MTRASRHEQIQTIDLALRGIAQRRAALDADEARWLREAERARIWTALGMVSMLDYMERVLGYSPRAACDRLRVSRALGELPVLAQALADGELSYSALREVTRVATPETESAWCDAARGQNLRTLEELVATHERGQLPSEPGDPDLRARVVRFEISPATFARLREAHAALDAERGARLDDDRFVAALCELALADTQTIGPTGRARHQIATTVCERCAQGWQTGGGVRIAVGADAVARAECDAQRVGSIHADVPARASHDVSPKTRRFVWTRDGGKCVVPGCRSARNLEIHHLVHRRDGGSHEPSNLCLLCDAHHAAHHAGTLGISGVAPERIVFAAARAARKPLHAEMRHVGAGRLDAAVRRVQLRGALVRIGWTRGVASAAVDAAITHVGTSAPDEVILREALRRCAVG
jgi:hypothetical protein